MATAKKTPTSPGGQQETGNEAPESAPPATAAQPSLTDRIAQGQVSARTDALKSRISTARDPSVEVGERSTLASLFPTTTAAVEFLGSQERRLTTGSFAQGALFGFADEAEAGIRAIWDRAPGEDYGDAYLRLRDRARGELAEFRERRPVLSIGAEIAGGFAVPGVGTGVAVARGATLGARVARGAAGGAGTGALFGAGTAGELEDVPREAGTGAVVGATAGTVLPAGVEAGRRTFSAVRSAVSPEAGAAQRIGQAVRRDEMTPEQIAGALDEARQLGRPATAADVGGEAVRRELEVAAQSPGAAGQIVERVLGPRNQGQLSRLSKDLVRGTGVKADVIEDVVTKTMTLRSNAARPVYARAMDFPAELNDDIVDAWNAAIKTPLGKQAMGKARKILNVEKFDEAPLMDRIDAFKRGLDDVIRSAKRKGENAIARKALEVKKELVELVDAVNPDYKKARQIWEDGSSYLNAIDRGREVLKPSFTAAKMRREIAEMTDAEQEAFRIGVVDAVVTRLRQQSAKEPNLIKLLRSPEMRDKLKAVMKPDRAAELDKILDIEDAMFRTASQARRGSPTAQRQAAMAEQEKQLSALRGLEFIAELAVAPLRLLFFRAMPAIPRATRERLLARQNAAIARRLLSSDPSEMLSIPQIRDVAPRITGGAAIPPAIIAADQPANP